MDNMKNTDLSIKNTTRDQRKEIVKNALAISITGSDFPSDKALEIVKEYVDGNLEIEEVQKKILSLYKKDGDN
jgi:hypothetical protein